MPFATDVVIDWVISTLQTDATVGKLTSGRIYKDRTETIGVAGYPVVTVGRRSPGFRENIAPLSEFDVMLSCHSTISMDEAWQLSEALQAALDHKNSGSGARKWCTYISSTPVDTVDTTADTIFQTHVFLTVRQLS